MTKLKESKVEKERFLVENFKLMKSELRREGPVYSEIETFNLE